MLQQGLGVVHAHQTLPALGVLTFIQFAHGLDTWQLKENQYTVLVTSRRI